MQKSTIIATCLVNSNMVGTLNDAESAVGRIFAEEFPDQRYVDWNTDLEDRSAAEIIRKVGRASRISVRQFIDELRRFNNSPQR